MSSILPTLGKDVSIDIGSIQTRLMGGTRGTVISEPSIIATDTKQEKVVAVGDEAARLVLRMPDMWRPLTPLKDGFIVDYRVMHTMLSYFLNKVSNALRRARVVVGVPCGMTDVEQRAMMDAVIQAGAREVFLIERPVAAAIGCGVPIFEAQGSMVIDIGGGTTDIAVLSLGDIVTSSSLKIAGDVMDADIIKFVKDKYKLLIGDRTAEQIKLEIGSAVKGSSDKTFEVRGRDLVTGLPHTITITSNETELALRETCATIVKETKHVLEQTPPELAADIVSRGIFLTGGGALLTGLDRLLESELNVPVFVADDALNCVANGCGVMLENLHYMK